jgi:hypothetical protein
MATLSTAAWIGHNLAIAADFGGKLFGQTALDAAVQKIDSPMERGEVLDAAWSTYKWIDVGALAVIGTTWLAGRTFLSGWEVGPASRGWVLAKDALVIGTVATGLAAAIVGSAIGAGHGGTSPAIRGGVPAPQASPRDAILQRAVKPLGWAHLACIAGVAATTTILSMKSGKSTLWSVVSRLLP